ncbi:MAG: hypothetical protein ACYC5N_04960 [Endomicrobiales bacterium]
MFTRSAVFHCPWLSIKSFMAGKVTAGFIAACMILNCLTPRLVIEVANSGLVSESVAQQPVVQQVLSLSALSLKIARALLNNLPLQSKKHQDPAQKRSHDSSSDFSIVSSAPKEGFERSDLSRGCLTGAGSAGYLVHRFRLLMTSEPHGSSADIHTFLLMLMLFCSFARGMLDTTVKAHTIRSGNPTCSGKPGFLFSFGINAATSYTPISFSGGPL